MANYLLADIIYSINRQERDGQQLTCPLDQNVLIRDKVSSLCEASEE